jgi:hypothetical protein
MSKDRFKCRLIYPQINLHQEPLTLNSTSQQNHSINVKFYTELFNRSPVRAATDGLYCDTWWRDLQINPVNLCPSHSLIPTFMASFGQRLICHASVTATIGPTSDFPYGDAIRSENINNSPSQMDICLQLSHDYVSDLFPSKRNYACR